MNFWVASGNSVQRRTPVLFCTKLLLSVSASNCTKLLCCSVLYSSIIITAKLGVDGEQNHCKDLLWLYIGVARLLREIQSQSSRWWWWGGPWCNVFPCSSADVLVCVQFCKRVLVVVSLGVSVCLVSNASPTFEDSSRAWFVAAIPGVRSPTLLLFPAPVIAMCTCVSYCLHAIEKLCRVCARQDCTYDRTLSLRFSPSFGRLSAHTERRVSSS